MENILKMTLRITASFFFKLNCEIYIYLKTIVFTLTISMCICRISVGISGQVYRNLVIKDTARIHEFKCESEEENNYKQCQVMTARLSPV